MLKQYKAYSNAEDATDYGIGKIGQFHPTTVEDRRQARALFDEGKSRGQNRAGEKGGGSKETAKTSQLSEGGQSRGSKGSLGSDGRPRDREVSVKDKLKLLRGRIPDSIKPFDPSTTRPPPAASPPVSLSDLPPY